MSREHMEITIQMPTSLKEIETELPKELERLVEFLLWKQRGGETKAVEDVSVEVKIIWME